MQLNGKTAFVTGSTSGIGLGIAKRLAASGANIVLNGFGDQDAIEQTRSDLARQHNLELKGLSVQSTSLDDVFLHYTGHGLAEAAAPAGQGKGGGR